MFHLSEEKNNLRLHIHNSIERDEIAKIEEEVDMVIGNRDPAKIKFFAEVEGEKDLVSKTLTGLVPSLRKRGISDIKIEN